MNAPLAPITYLHETSPAPGTAVPIVPGIEWLCMPLPFALNHINLWLLADGDAYTAVDTGYALDEIKEAWKSVLAGRRLARCIVTHFHPDHLGLAEWLETETGAPLWISQGDYLTAHLAHAGNKPFSTTTMTAFFRHHGLAEKSAVALDQGGNAFRVGVPAISGTYRQLFDGEVIVIGDHAWRTIVSYGHAPEHMSLYCEELHVLISGDMLLPRISTNIPVLATNPHGNPLKLFLDSLDALRALPEDTLVLPSHGRPFRGLHARVEQLHVHHAERCAVLVEACRSMPKSAADLITVLFGRDIDDSHQIMFAMGEAIAHLNYLEHAGAMRRVEESHGIRYISRTLV